MSVELKRTPDILAELGRRKRPEQILVGFSAESEDLLENSLKKLKEKNLDMIVANDISRRDSGFASDYNQATILTPDGGREELPLLSKRELASKVLDRVVSLRSKSEA